MRLKSYKNLSISCFSFFLNYAFVITIIPTSTLLSVSFLWWFFLIFWLNGLPLAQDKISARYSNDMAVFKQEEDYNFLLKKVTKLNLFSISQEWKKTSTAAASGKDTGTSRRKTGKGWRNHVGELWKCIFCDWNNANVTFSLHEILV